MQALILAGGLGTRLRSLVRDNPKAMTKFGDKPFLEYLMGVLKSYQINQLILCVGYLYQQIYDYFGNGANWGVQIDYSIEKSLLGTAGAIKHAEFLLGKTFLVLNGDTFLDLNLDRFMDFHNKKKAESEPDNYLGTIALTGVENNANYGSVMLNGDGFITKFEEKADKKPEKSNGAGIVNAGVYVLEREILNFIPSSESVSIERDTFPQILNKGYTLSGYFARGIFIDIGTPQGYYRFQGYLKDSSQ